MRSSSAQRLSIASSLACALMLVSGIAYRLLLRWHPFVVHGRMWKAGTNAIAVTIVVIFLGATWALLFHLACRFKKSTGGYRHWLGIAFRAVVLPITTLVLIRNASLLEQRRHEDGVFLKHLWCALASYADDNNNEYPLHLSQLVEKPNPYFAAISKLVMHTRSSISLSEIAEDKTDYVYRGKGISMDDSGGVMQRSSEILMHTKRGLLGGYVSVLFADGRSEPRSEKELDSLLSQSK